MTQPLLSILIPTVVGREEQLDRLFHKIISTYAGEGVLVSFAKDNKEMTIGEKRGKMYKGATGLYSWQIDDDDDISDDALVLIIQAIEMYGSDCVTFREHCEMDGKVFKSNHSLQYGDWEGEGHVELSDGFHFHRTPFMKDVIKTEIARSVPIPHIRFGEDHQWSQALKPHLKSETHIEKEIYKYIHNSTDPTERYGLDR
jgi:hypothetical protein